MAKICEGHLIGTGKVFGIVVSRFNELIGRKLLEGSIDCLIRHGVRNDDIFVFWTPGAYEIPITAMRLARSGKYHAVICLGAIIRGETPHYEYVASESAKGVAEVGLSTGVPTIYGIIVTETLEHAIDRAGARDGNKGVEAALAAIELANLFESMGKQ
ncbi:MAG TPA: 6,7-dimethyl-8-ribityllumazine synthase [Candidatus Brocadiia bacterium]|nr:6,7-dimethyl-8-ribityllumazine synthase [Planctomycetota bacterium]MBI4007762.1 6,7-dimethyl-8-ribityllumazine synthase [Planctomycetota bacterium]MDO8093157.1 6,7-dimethyl-8-ribityllumazine synthase [Candidatus Brocadiales bacterium]